MTESKTDVLLLMLMGIVILLMVAIVGLFIRVNQLQREVLAALAPFQLMREPQGLEIGAEAPAFTLPDPTGQMVSLDDFAGQRVLLVFSSPQCPACIEMYPHLRAFSERERDVQVVMVSRGSAEENRAQQGFGFPVLTWDDRVAQEYQVPGTPFFYVIDEEGVIANAGFASTLEQLEALVGAPHKPESIKETGQRSPCPLRDHSLYGENNDEAKDGCGVDDPGHVPDHSYRRRWVQRTTHASRDRHSSTYSLCGDHFSCHRAGYRDAYVVTRPGRRESVSGS